MRSGCFGVSAAGTLYGLCNGTMRNEKMRRSQPTVLLVHPVYGRATNERIFQPGVEMPISLAYLSSYLEANDIPSDILDLRLEDNPMEALRKRIGTDRPRVVGITASTANIGEAAATADAVKRADQTIATVIGGWHASALPEQTLAQYPQFDYLVHGEGERTLMEIALRLTNSGCIEDVRGLAFRENGSVRVNDRGPFIEDLDSVPIPAVEKLDVRRYRPSPGTRNYLRLPSVGVLVGRGCPYRCRFCYKGVWGDGVRWRSPENVLEEIEMYVDRYGVRDFRFYDDTITFRKWPLEEFCREVIRRKLDINWNCWSRVNDVDEAKLRLMKESGCYHIKFGIEFGTEKALKLSRKGARLEDARTAVAMCRKVGVECKGSFIFGIPGETIEDCRKTMDFAVDLSPDFASFYAYDPIPGSPFYEQICSGEIDPDRDMLPRQQAEKLANDAYRAFYVRPEFVFRRGQSFFRYPLREGRMLLDGSRMILSYWLSRRNGSSGGNGKAELLEQLDASEQPITGATWTPAQAAVVRAIDFVTSVVGLILTFPIMLILAMIIRLDSHGPAIFRQTRVGRNRRSADPSSKNGSWDGVERRRLDLGGKPFTFRKFRTMYVDARARFPELYRYVYDDEEIRTMRFKLAEDPRLTRVGRRLRKTTLDELPNLISVLNGDMTLIGPRPEIPEMVKYYTPWQRAKFSVKPGVTGLAQVNGRGLLSFQETARLDVEYVRCRSLRAMFGIILKTLEVTLLRIGAF